jgi:hypothetical protein
MCTNRYKTSFLVIDQMFPKRPSQSQKPTNVNNSNNGPWDMTHNDFVTHMENL